MVTLLLAAVLLAGAGTAAPCDAGCEVLKAREQMAAGDLRGAVDSLKAARRRHPDERRLVLWLVRAYLEQGNLFWAERTLREGLERWPGDPELEAWLVSVLLRQGDPELAAERLREAPRELEDPSSARFALLEAAQLRLAAEAAGARERLLELDRSRSVFAEDRELWLRLMGDADPWWQELLRGSLELGAGSTSNALAGSPTDPGSSGERSGIGQVELKGELRVPRRGRWALGAELELSGYGIGNESYQDFSSLQAGLRLGAVRKAPSSRMSIGYRAERLWLDREDSLYSEAHRGELELEWASGRVLFGGAGHREYLDERRTRWEADMGFGAPLPGPRGAPLVGGASLRMADAESPAYDQLGLSAVISTSLRLPWRSTARIALSTSYDDYFNSGGGEGQAEFGSDERRRDLLARVRAELWAPSWRGLRPGLELRYSQRWSTADDRPGSDFSYREWRAVVWLRIDFAFGAGGPRVSRPADHVPLDWGLEDERGLDEERILDLLRRDEELRRGCGLDFPG